MEHKNSRVLGSVVVKGCCRIDSIVLGQHAVYDNLERKEKPLRIESVSVTKIVSPVSNRIL